MPRRKRSEASSSQARPRAPADIPPNRHMYNRFHYQDEEDEVVQYLTRSFLDVIFVSWPALEILGIKRDIRAFLPPPWRRLVHTNVPQYIEPTIEFFMTYYYDPNIQDVNNKSIFFRLGGQQRELSMKEFASALGIYNEDEMGMVGIWEDYDDRTLLDFWRTISTVAFKTSTTKGTALTDPRHHILHRILTTTIFNRRESINNINLADLRVLYPLITGRQICPAAVLAQAFIRLRGTKGSLSPVAGGQFITLIGRSLGIWRRDAERQLFTATEDPRPLSLDTLKTMLLVKKVNNRWVLCQGPSRQPWVRQEGEPSGARANPQEPIGGDEGHREPEDHFNIPQYQQLQPPGYGFVDAAHYDPYIAYTQVMAGISNLSTNMQALDTNFQQYRRSTDAYQASMDRRVTNLCGTVYAVKDTLNEFRQEFRAYRDQGASGSSAMDEDDDEDDNE